MTRNRILRYSMALVLVGASLTVQQVLAQETKPIINAALTGTVIDANSK